MRTLPALMLVAFATGCGGPPPEPIATPAYNPDEMAAAAVLQYDRSGDGALDPSEVEGCPGLRSAFPHVDTNGDKKLTPAELRTRFEGYTSAGAVGFPISLALDGSPLADATVTFTPETFMGGVVGPVTARTGPDGRAGTFTIDGRELPGLPPGVYRISITRDGATIPAKYNTESTLGCEVSAGGRGGSAGLDLKLTGR